MKAMTSILEAIGNTPLVELSRITRSLPGRILLKLDYLNPGFSTKDRAALGIIEEAERSGALRAGQTVVELTSGNMGTGLAIVCAVKGHPFVAVMSRGNSMERARMMRVLGAEVVLVEQAPGSLPGQVSGEDLKRVEMRARELTQERNAFRADQFVREGNWHAHAEMTGPEILRQAGHIDAFCDFVGSGGTFRGCSQTFRAANPSVRCYVVEPVGAAALAGQAIVRPSHRIQGGGYSMRDLKFLEGVAVDGYLQSDRRGSDHLGTPAGDGGRDLRRIFHRCKSGRSSTAIAWRTPRPHYCHPGLRLGTQIPEHRPMAAHVIRAERLWGYKRET
jgi:cysteine synthase A